jgi:hypothetical protein
MRNFFFESAIAIPQLEGSPSAIAILQLFKAMLLCNRNSAIAFFSEIRIFKSATSDLHFRNFQHIFVRGLALNYIFFLPPGVFCY